MKVRSRAPLRLGLAGGGTDVSPYSDTFGGCVLNATINMYAHCTIECGEHLEGVEFEAKDINEKEAFSLSAPMPLDQGLLLHRAVYTRVVNEFLGGRSIPIRVVTYCDAPPGSGLGSSSTMVVAMLEAFKTAFSLPLGEYDIAQLAFDIERVDCSLSGGKQDQYAATFGGVNFMEFCEGSRVIVNPLRIRRYIMSEIEESLVLFFTGASRDSANIISDQMKSISSKEGASLDAMHAVKASAIKIKEHLLKGEITELINAFKLSWEAKKRTSKSISNSTIDKVEQDVFRVGALSLKVSGAGGGGFMMIFCNPEDKPAIEAELLKSQGQVHRVQFTSEGCTSWTI
ncbi:hypothetical protein [Agaribacterium sp. ZY112]|uniref:GHMP family kinase ATP-binding protein n=1 Tax=Agaribacterium sp. ZY112 TaxID=3233574 RepID=UPI003523205F